VPGGLEVARAGVNRKIACMTGRGHVIARA
jgi:hypothetical protein